MRLLLIPRDLRQGSAEYAVMNADPGKVDGLGSKRK